MDEPLNQHMPVIPKRGRDEFEYSAVWAESADQGTMTDNLLSATEIARRADLGVGLKDRGCVAMRDLTFDQSIQLLS